MSIIVTPGIGEKDIEHKDGTSYEIDHYRHLHIYASNPVNTHPKKPERLIATYAQWERVRVGSAPVEPATLEGFIEALRALLAIPEQS